MIKYLKFSEAVPMHNMFSKKEFSLMTKLVYSERLTLVFTKVDPSEASQ